MKTLGKASKINIIEDEKMIPKGCGMAAIGGNKIFLELGKHIDVKKELDRLNKKLGEM